MTAAAPREQSRIRGWCPGALRPMESGDGLLVRVRPRAGRLATGDVIAIAAAAERYGNGLIDLTRRANLQLRGLSAESLPDLWGRSVATPLDRCKRGRRSRAQCHGDSARVRCRP